jgi:hypothetical protein
MPVHFIKDIVWPFIHGILCSVNSYVNILNHLIQSCVNGLFECLSFFYMKPVLLPSQLIMTLASMCGNGALNLSIFASLPLGMCFQTFPHPHFP